MNDVVIVVPVLNRPANAQPLVDAIEAATPEPHRILFVGTQGDNAELHAVKATGADLTVLPGRRIKGDYARKINHAYRCTTEPYLFMAADDIRPHPGWLTSALAVMDDVVQVVGTNDLCNARVMKGIHSTHTLVARRYVDQQGTIDTPGIVLCEAYNHWYVDDEFVQTAQYRGVFRSALDSRVEHFHPMRKDVVITYDRTYRIGESRRQADRNRYASRCGMWGMSSPNRKPRIVPDPVTGIVTAVIDNGAAHEPLPRLH